MVLFGVFALLDKTISLAAALKPFGFRSSIKLKLNRETSHVGWKGNLSTECERWNMQVKQIMLTTDFSDHARGAYQRAADLASQFDATVHLVHFASAIPELFPTATGVMLLKKLEEQINEEANGHVAFEGINVQPCLQPERWTRSRQRTLEQDLDIDLIVMAPHGRTGLTKMLLGSFADRVVRHSSVPVLLSRTTEKTPTFNPKTILVPHDFYDQPRAILPTVRWLATNFDSEFHFFHVYDPSWADFHSVRSMESQFAKALKVAPTVEERFAKLVESELQGINAKLETAQGLPAMQVVQRANQLPADLVLVGKRAGLGSVARSVVREASCCVLTVPLVEAE